ncbi:hypothetical protein WKI65_01915 [Streptomyces sp. MS1.AVA.3]|uniref:hypothetical protein n=1 Tax=Streptomyces decoyicus TaxID=249567 RepID=UPI0030C1500E
MLNSLALQGPLTRQALGRLLKSFWQPGARTLDEVVDVLAGRGRITADGDTLALTPAGRRAHAEAASQADVSRARLLRGLTEDDYLRTVAVLDRMTANMASGR